MTGFQDYERLWDGSEPGWVLWYVAVVDDADDLRNWSIFNVESKMAVVIEDDAVAAEVIAELRSRNVEVITEYPS